MSQHAVLAPSGAETWMTCAGSAAMQKGLPDDANEYTDEGTAAHLLGSTCLEAGRNPSEFLGIKIFVGSAPDFDGASWGFPLPGFVTRRTYVVDEEMADHVQKYVDAVREYTKGGEMHAERRVSIEKFTGEKDAAGTADASGVFPEELQLHDLKYGMGVRVFAKRNKQLMLYGLGLREEMDFLYGPFKRIRFVIHQPRLDWIDEWDCTSEELDAFAEEVRERAAVALAILASGYGAKPCDLAPSEDGCRWCKAKATCPGLAKFVEDNMVMDFECAAGEPEHNAHAEFLQMAQVGPADLARKLAAVPLIEDWCKAIRAKVESELFAGVAIPGWKIVQGKKGNRQWEDEAKADALLKTMRLKIEERCNLKLKSPTQIEKVLKATPRRLKRLVDANLIIQRDGKPSVAPESDPREVWAPPDSAADFEAVTTEEEMT